MAATQNYTGTPRVGTAHITAASTSLDNPGANTFNILQGASGGTRCNRVIAKLSPSTGFVAGATSANVLRLWINDGARLNYYRDVALAAFTVPAAAAANQVILNTVEIPTPNLVLESATQYLVATLHTRAAPVDDFTLIALGGNLGSTVQTYAATPRIGAVLLNAADTALDNPSTNVFTVLTPAASGTRIERIHVRHNGVVATAASANTNAVRLWLYDTVAAQLRLYKEVLTATYTPSASAVNTGYEIPTPDLVLPSGTLLRATLHYRTGGDARDNHTVTALGADL